MPTKLPRHTITETPDVQAALDGVRRATGEHRVPLAELVVLGAHEKVRQLHAQRVGNDALVTALADRIRRREPLVDLHAADEVRRTGWTHDA